MTVRFGLIAGPAFPKPRAWWGFGQGPAHFVTVAPSMVFITGGVKVTSLASMARVTRFMSSLTGMFGWNLISFALRQGQQSPRVAFCCSLTRLPIDSPSMEILWAQLEARLN